MPITSIVLIGAMTVVSGVQGVQSLGGERSAPQPKAGNAVSRPYQKIFTAPKPEKPGQVRLAPEAELKVDPNLQPRVVCGMVVVPVSPALDPKMLAHTPKEPNVEYKIRVIEPTICKE